LPCFFPLSGWLSKSRNDTGKRSIVFSISNALIDKPVVVDCGQCTGCRMALSQDWALRSVHEASCYEHNLFVTLTFSDSVLHKRGRFIEDKSLSADNSTAVKWLSKYSVDVRDIQLFMKRLRDYFKYVGADGSRPIRYYHCGEYGECCRVCGLSKSSCKCRRFYSSIGRPHYHICLFNCKFDDMEFYKANHRGDILYTSATLEKLWGQGFCPIGRLTYKSAAYTARYVMKKLNGDAAELPDLFGLLPYERMDVNTGEIHDVEREYTTMSRRSGIGGDWFKRYWKDAYPHDYIVYDGVKHRVPRYYDKLLEKLDPDMLLRVKKKRLKRALARASDNTSQRLDVRKRVHDVKLSMLNRNEVLL